jgi:type VI secretion system ImpA family protein
VEILALEELLAPLRGVLPCGENLRFAPEWDDVETARGSQREAWQFGGKRDADWFTVKELTCGLLVNRSKDLRLLNFLTEACVGMNGFEGAAAALQFGRELIAAFWDKGLHPVPDEDNGSMQDRADVLSWFNERFADTLAAVPYTARRDSGVDYCLNDLRHARFVGWERDTLDSSGFSIESKRKAFDDSIKAGLISLDLYGAAIKTTQRKPLEEVCRAFQSVRSEFAEFSKVIDQKLGDSAPDLSATRAVLEEIGTEVEGILERKRSEEPDKPTPTAAPARVQTTGPQPAGLQAAGGEPAADVLAEGAWGEAERLVKSGQVEDGLRLMSRLAASASAGRDRFHRKLLLVDVCLQSGRHRLARTILEELNEQITKHRLDEWERPEVAGNVWSRLYSIYKQAEPDNDRTRELYERLSRLDPWQTFALPED